MNTSTDNTKKETLPNQNTKDSKVKKERPFKEIAEEMHQRRLAAMNNLDNHDKSN